MKINNFLSFLALAAALTATNDAHAFPYKMKLFGTANVGGYDIPIYSTSRKEIFRKKYSFSVSRSDASKLGVYIFPYGITVLAPRDMEPSENFVTGTDGNFSAMMENDKSMSEWISINEVPACQGCAFSYARNWLPWVTSKYWCGLGLCGKTSVGNYSDIKRVRLGLHVTAISYNDKSEKNINGIIEYNSNENSNIPYLSEWFYTKNLSHNISTDVLNFFYKYDIKQKPFTSAKKEKTNNRSFLFGELNYHSWVNKHIHNDLPSAVMKEPKNEQIWIIKHMKNQALFKRRLRKFAKHTYEMNFDNKMVKLYKHLETINYGTSLGRVYEHDYLKYTKEMGIQAYDSVTDNISFSDCVRGFAKRYEYQWKMLNK